MLRLAGLGFFALASVPRTLMVRTLAGSRLLCQPHHAVQRSARPFTQRAVRMEADDDAGEDDGAVGEGVMNGARRRQLRALAGRLQADGKLTVITVLGVDFTPHFLGTIARTLDQHELIKLRFRDVASKKEVKVIADEIATGRGAHLTQVVGHTALLYRARAAEVGPPLVTFDEAGKAHMDWKKDEGEKAEMSALDAVFTGDDSTR
ncbi:hypothetical protein T492DRAFT_962570 [Pavlovales sp. CCMP2436]|nr:hypothetical protein T492DRAFT_962570 [Pavlovales sp. CCMP2436]